MLTTGMIADTYRATTFFQNLSARDGFVSSRLYWTLHDEAR